MSTYETHRPLRTPAPPPKRLVIMGVSGCGKTSLADGLGVALGWDVLDADHLHPATNIEKMRQGIPLQDADRWPWLDAVATSLAAPLGASDGRVVACSALKRVYRETIRRGCPGTHFVFLEGTFEAVLPRLQAPSGALHARVPFANAVRNLGVPWHGRARRVHVTVNVACCRAGCDRYVAHWPALSGRAAKPGVSDVSFGPF